MNKIKVLVEGYARERGSGYEASSSATLIQTENLKIVCDPGLNVNLLEKGLADQGLIFKDIDWVFVTHWHPVTCYSVSRFTNATVIDYRCKYFPDLLDAHDGIIPKTDLKIFRTPGHTIDHASLIVPVGKTVYAVAGDVFWWDEYEEQLTDRKSLLEKKDPLAVDEKALRKSRESLLEIADFIIPGHGKTFAVSR